MKTNTLTPAFSSISARRMQLDANAPGAPDSERRSHAVCAADKEDRFLSECRSKTILAVEDEEFLREVNCAVLQRHGYRVLAASSGPEALKVAQAEGRIDLLLTDIVLPDRMTGCELARVLLAQQPDLHVLYTSGYSAEMDEAVCVQNARSHFLQKPYDAETLCEHVRESSLATVHRDVGDSSAQAAKPDPQALTRVGDSSNSDDQRNKLLDGTSHP